MSAWLTPVLGLLGAFVGSSLAPWLTAHLAWRRTRREAFNAAISALRAAQVARHFANGVPAHYVGGDVDTVAAYNQRLRERGIDRFVDAMHEAKLALAALEPFYRVSGDLDRWEITEPDADRMLTELLRTR
ncbi:hypothetical protein SAMN05428945_3242 [Streptomyces sp. 2224.1]|uniref:hypothetical protein n=1 Tax=Streptomyces sp. 2224.1 TaxID=1881020 RepID=UPI00089C1D20|nr:hypothetical protein [Streptomyces sp. 2224.1]SEC56392.1 hypothetical protein SAMN05428945_3242 [Streptomyces sp. 2224.1]SEF00688.1 hypothetical protein SAMN05428954_5193 [Streptomyces sp. 2112.3]